MVQSGLTGGSPQRLYDKPYKSDNSRAATIAVFIMQILIHCFHVSCIMFLDTTTACPRPVTVSSGPVLLISMLFQPSSLDDRQVLNRSSG